jgi:hypothetical protein
MKLARPNRARDVPDVRIQPRVSDDQNAAAVAAAAPGEGKDP